jgi:hypothetical protein
MHHRGADAPAAEPATLTSITDEVSMGVYCRRMRISALQARQAFLGLVDFVYAQLKCQRGVSLPGLGSFAVGPCVDTYNGGAISQRAPVFALSPKFESVPQERGRFFLTKPVTYARIPTMALAERCGVHKAGATHVLKEIIAIIAQRLFDGAPVDVDFTFGRLHNVHPGGRVEFTFNQTFTAEMGILVEGARAPPRDAKFLVDATRELTRKVTTTTPKRERAAAKAKAEAAAQTKFEVTTETVPLEISLLSAATPPRPSTSSSSRPATARARANAANAKTEPGARLIAICDGLDRLKNGLVDRLKLERALNSDECHELVADVPARVALAALRECSGGREGRFVRYVPLVVALEAAAAEAAEARLPDPAAAAEARAAAAAEAAAAAAAAAAETAEVAKAAKELAAAAIAAVCRGPDDPAEPIAELFHAHGSGARGLSRMEVTAFNRSYAPAVRAYNVASAGGVTPKVTNNHALELTEPRREPTNPLGLALQEQIDRKVAEEKEAAARERKLDRERLAAAAAAAAAEEAAERDAKRKQRDALVAGWVQQKGAVAPKIVKFDQLK